MLTVFALYFDRIFEARVIFGSCCISMIISIILLLVMTIMFIVFMERALRKILINYPKRQMGNKIYGGESSHLPL